MAKKGNRKKKRQTQDPIHDFFALYPEFEYDDTNGPTQEFRIMCKVYRWDWESAECQEARTLFQDALIAQFNTMYGKDIHDIENWHRLCVAFNIEPLSSITQCRKAINKIHVNLVDLVDTSQNHAKIFPSISHLRQYTHKTGKIFPKKEAKAGGMLKFLLRKIF